MEYSDNLKNIIGTSQQTDYLMVIVSLFFCIFSSFISMYVYKNKSNSLSSKKQIAPIIPVLSCITFLVILIVKSSLALSLGLVGALSVIRFRTPIKEPEELVYLFLAISIGIGYGSGQILITSILILIMFLIIYIWLSNRKINSNSEYNLIINWKTPNIEINLLLNEVSTLSEGYKLIRSEIANADNTLVILVNPKEINFIDILSKNLKKIDESISLTFFESNTNW